MPRTQPKDETQRCLPRMIAVTQFFVTDPDCPHCGGSGTFDLDAQRFRICGCVALTSVAIKDKKPRHG